MKSSLLSVVIPSYNEMANLQKGILDKVERYLSKQSYDFEIIVVDDGSTDGSREFVQKYAKENKKTRVIENNHTGKAGAVTAGMLEAHGDIVLFTDMDQATPIEELENCLPYFEKGFDIVIGSRRARSGAPLSRKFMSKANVMLRSVIVGMGDITDTQCGFKLFTQKASQDIFSRIKKIHHGFKQIHGSSVTSGFDIEVLYIGRMLGYKIQQVPVHWLYVETRRVSPVRDSINGVFDLLKIRKNILSGVYGK